MGKKALQKIDMFFKQYQMGQKTDKKIW